MKYLVITDDASDEQIHAGINELRRRQASAVIPSTRDELADDIDELLEMLTAHHSLPAAAGPSPAEGVIEMPG